MNSRECLLGGRCTNSSCVSEKGIRPCYIAASFLGYVMLGGATDEQIVTSATQLAGEFPTGGGYPVADVDSLIAAANKQASLKGRT